MNDKKFEAILAKNCIAREIRKHYYNPVGLSVDYVVEQLKCIEKWIGQGNQPSVAEIIESDFEI